MQIRPDERLLRAGVKHPSEMLPILYKHLPALLIVYPVAGAALPDRHPFVRNNVHLHRSC